MAVNYTEIGTGEALILIPGTLGDEYLFEKVQVPLAERLKSFRIIVVDHLDLESLDDVIEWYHSFFTQELEISSFHLGGTSVGGWIAQHYAMKYPDEVKSPCRRFITFDTHGH